MSQPTLAGGLSPVRGVLDNGVIAIVQHRRTARAVAINAAFAAGSVRDPESLPGLAYLAGLVVDRGTASRSAEAIAEALDDRGVALRVAVTRHAFTLSCTCLAEDFLDILALLGEITARPAFPEVELEKRRAEAITAVRQDADSTGVRATEGVLELLYGEGHPYARPGKGTPGSLESMCRADLLQFQSRHLVPAALRVVIAGEAEPSEALDAIATRFTGWQGPEPEAEIVPAPATRGRQSRVITMPAKLQTDIAYGFTAIRRLDPRFYAYWIMNNILGQFGLGGRLAETIREEQGMAYYAFSSFDGTVGEGPLLIRAGVDPLDVTRALAAIDREVEKLHREGPTVEEVEDSRESLIGAIPRTLETNEGIAEFLQNAEQFGLGLDYDRRLPGLLREVRFDDVRQAAVELLDTDRASFAVAGPGIDL